MHIDTLKRYLKNDNFEILLSAEKQRYTYSISYDDLKKAIKEARDFRFNEETPGTLRWFVRTVAGESAVNVTLESRLIERNCETSSDLLNTLGSAISKGFEALTMPWIPENIPTKKQADLEKTYLLRILKIKKSDPLES